jgi:hypothetical protein
MTMIAARTPSPINPLTGKVRTNVPRIPTTAEMQVRLRDMLPGLRVYNPSDQWLQPEIHGITNRWIPPDLSGAIDAHPVTGLPTVCDGVIEIKGRYPMLDGKPQKDSSGKVIEGQDAASVVAFLVGQEQWGQIGIVFLPGNSPQEDAELKEIGRRVWLDYQKKADDAIVSRRVEFKQNWDKNPAKKGTPCPPPSEVETSAIERQQTRTREKKFMYSCDVPDCPGFAVNEWDRFKTHMQLAHGRAVKREMFDSEVSAFGPVVAASAEDSDPGDDEQISIAAAALAKANRDTAAALAAKSQEAPIVDDDDDDLPTPPSSHPSSHPSASSIRPIRTSPGKGRR